MNRMPTTSTKIEMGTENWQLRTENWELRTENWELLMNSPPSIPRYNQPIPRMRARASSGLRFAWLTSFLFATALLPTSLFGSNLADTARQLAHKIAAVAGPGAFAL